MNCRDPAKARTIERAYGAVVWGLRSPPAGDIAGNIAMPGFTAPKIAWVRKHEPEVFDKLAKVLLPKAGSEGNPAKATLKLNAKTGQVSGTFILADTGPPGSTRPVQRKAAYQGLIYTGTAGRKAYGYFMLPALPETAAQPATSTTIESGQMLLEAP